MNHLPFIGKKLLVLGGNGYIGSAISTMAASLGAKVTAVTKSGINRDKKISSQVEFVSGSPGDLAALEKYLRETDAVIHSMGLIADLLGSKMHTPAGEGACEGLNRETAKGLGRFLSMIGGKKMVYLSIIKDPVTLKSTEEFLFKQNLKTSILRLGFVNALNDTGYFKVQKNEKNAALLTKMALQKLTVTDPFTAEALNSKAIENCNDVNTVAKGSIYAAFLGKYDSRVIESRDIAKIVEENKHLEKFGSEGEDVKRESRIEGEQLSI